VNRLKLRGEGEFIPQLAAYVGHVHLHLLARSLYGTKKNPTNSYMSNYTQKNRSTTNF
jgi:hypothetical protein